MKTIQKKQHNFERRRARIRAKIKGKWDTQSVDNLKPGSANPWEDTQPTELEALRNGKPIEELDHIDLSGIKYRNKIQKICSVGGKC